MEKFARRTCIGETGCTPTRYLWTDAFAVCNYLGLFHQTGDEKYKKKALILLAGKRVILNIIAGQWNLPKQLLKNSAIGPLHMKDGCIGK
ncbi:MAG: hypothetical protein IE885_08030 [Campylobacterales bacterium]|nr:hypothetical protein [Campylobacterales bacterium]